MEFVITDKLVIRNFTEDDIKQLEELRNEITADSIKETLDIAKNAFNDDFDSDGDKRFAIEIDSNFVGITTVTLQKPYMYINVFLHPTSQNRQNYQLILLNLIKYLHKAYSHRQIITYVSRFNFQVRGILENLGFIRSALNKKSDLYTYTLFKPNINKEK